MWNERTYSKFDLAHRLQLKNGNLKTVHLGYVKRMYLKLDSYRSFYPFYPLCLTIILCYIIIYSS